MKIEIPKKLKARFIWEKDSKIDTYHILDPEGTVRGDCDDYAVTIGYELADRSFVKFLWYLITFQHVYWFVYDPNGQSHICIWARGYGWTDNWNNQFNSTPTPHTKRYPALWPIVLFKLFLGLFEKK